MRISDETSEAEKQLKEYLRDRERIDKEIWSFVDVKGKRVIDVGVGDSTKRLFELGARVIGIDISLNKLKSLRDSNIPLILGNFLCCPLRSRQIDLIVFHFILHEISPALHSKAISIARQFPKVVIVEPSPSGCKAFEKYWKLWREAIHSVGKFEDYKPLEYWKSLLEGDFKVKSRKIRWKANVPLAEFEKIVSAAIEECRRLGVREEYIQGFRDLLDYVEVNQFRWSDIGVVVGFRDL